MSQAVETLRLKEPIDFGSQKIVELAIRKPKARDFRSMPSVPKMGDMLDFLGHLSAQPKAVIDDLCVEDMNAALEVVGGFFGSGPETGSED